MKVKTLKKQIICLVPLELRCIRGTSFGKTKGNILQLRTQYLLSGSWYKLVVLPLEDRGIVYEILRQQRV